MAQASSCLKTLPSFLTTWDVVKPTLSLFREVQMHSTSLVNEQMGMIVKLCESDTVFKHRTCYSFGRSGNPSEFG